LNKVQASNLDLDKQIVELANSLKKCQDEKQLVEAALHDSKKHHEKLNKTREVDLKMIENLRKYADKSTKTIDELRSTNAELSTKNTKLAKTLSTKEQMILDLEKAPSERSENLNKDVNEIKQNVKLLFEEYKEALKQFGTHLNPLRKSDDVSDLMD
jgi:chromosome segregation ATPase